MSAIVKRERRMTLGASVAAIVHFLEHRERIHRSAHSTAERGPSGAGPLGNAR
jgi:hypothetical protein